MSMSTYANHVITTNEKIIKKVCKKEYGAFIRALGKVDTDLNTYAEAIDHEEQGDYPIGVMTAYDNLQKAFRKATRLTLALSWTDPENGERGDDVSGHFWEIHDAKDWTPAAKKFCKQHGANALADSFFTTWG